MFCVLCLFWNGTYEQVCVFVCLFVCFVSALEPGHIPASSVAPFSCLHFGPYMLSAYHFPVRIEKSTRKVWRPVFQLSQQAMAGVYGPQQLWQGKGGSLGSWELKTAVHPLRLHQGLVHMRNYPAAPQRLLGTRIDIEECGRDAFMLPCL